MRVTWRRPSERPYLSFDEETVVSTRLHPIVAIVPFVQLAVFTYTALLVTSFLGWLGAVFVIAALLQWARMRNGPIGKLSFQTVAIIVGGFLLLTQLLDNLIQVIYLIILFGLGYAAYQLLQYFFTTIYVTDLRIFRISGVIKRTVATMPLRSLTDIRYEQTLPGRILDYGHFDVESAGQKQALSAIRFIERPRAFYRIIMTEALGGKLPPDMLRKMAEEDEADKAGY